MCLGPSHNVASDCCRGVKEARDCPTRSPVTVVEVWKRPGTVLPGHQWPVVEVWKKPGAVLPGRQWPVVEVWMRPGLSHQVASDLFWKCERSKARTVPPGCQWPVEVWKRPGWCCPTMLSVNCFWDMKEARDCPTRSPVTCAGVKEARLVLSHHVASDLFLRCERGQAGAVPPCCQWPAVDLGKRPGQAWIFLFKGSPKQRSTTGPISKNRIKKKKKKKSQQFFWQLY